MLLSPRGLEEPENSREYDPFRTMFSISVWFEAVVIGITAVVVVIEHMATPEHDPYENHQAVAAGVFTAAICVSYLLFARFGMMRNNRTAFQIACCHAAVITVILWQLALYSKVVWKEQLSISVTYSVQAAVATAVLLFQIGLYIIKYDDSDFKMAAMRCVGSHVNKQRAFERWSRFDAMVFLQLGIDLLLVVSTAHVDVDENFALSAVYLFAIAPGWAFGSRHLFFRGGHTHCGSVCLAAAGNAAAAGFLERAAIYCPSSER